MAVARHYRPSRLGRFLRTDPGEVVTFIVTFSLAVALALGGIRWVMT
jgi:hypothetical protein